MSEGTKWTPGKIFLLVIGILAGLCVLCCGGLWLLLGDKAMSAYALAAHSEEFNVRLQNDYGKTASFGVAKNDQAELVLTIGAEGELTAERVAEIQDGAWRTFGDVFGKDGFFPVRHLAVGRPVVGSAKQGETVIGWSGNIVSAEELVKRTGVPVPPLAAVLPADFDGSGVQVKVTVGGTEEPDAKGKEEEGKDEEGGGGGTGGK